MNDDLDVKQTQDGAVTVSRAFIDRSNATEEEVLDLLEDIGRPPE